MNKKKQWKKKKNHTVGSFEPQAEPLISSPAWVDSVTVLLAGDSSSFHLLEDLLCLKSQVKSDGIAKAEDGESFWFSFSAGRGPSRITSNFWPKKALK